MRSIKKIIFLYMIADIVLILICFIVGGKTWIINSQVAFISSLLVTLASFQSYKKLVQDRSSLMGEDFQDRDELDVIDDPYELYDEQKDFKEVIKKKRKKVTNLKTTFINLKDSSRGIFSLVRLGAYLFLFASFLYLVKADIFSIAPYMIGLFIVPFVALLSVIM